jgi:hypothetical protein
VPRLPGIGFDLLAQTANVDCDGARVDGGLFTVSRRGTPARCASRPEPSSSISPKAIVCRGPESPSLRRSTVRTRAASSRGENGFVT